MKAAKTQHCSAQCEVRNGQHQVSKSVSCPPLAPQVGPYRVTKVYLPKNVMGLEQMDMLVKCTADPLIMFLWVMTIRFYLGFGERGPRIGIDQFAGRFQDSLFWKH